MPILTSILGAQAAAKAAPYIEKGIKIVAAVGIVALAFTLGQCKGAADKENEMELESVEAKIEVLSDVAAANETAGDERLSDAKSLGEQREELDNARNHQGDDAVTRELRSLCSIVRQQRGTATDNPACAGLEGEAGARAPGGGPANRSGVAGPG